MPTSSGTGLPAGAAPHDCSQRIAALVVQRGDLDSRRAVAKLAQEQGWCVNTVYEVSNDEVQRRILPDAHGGAFQVLAIPCLSLLGPRPIDALTALEVLAALGITVESATEAWLAESMSAVALVARWLNAENRKARTAKIKASMVRSGRRAGRPRRSDIPVAEAHRLVVEERWSVGRAARFLAIPESTLRHALAERRVEERFASITVAATQEVA